MSRGVPVLNQKSGMIRNSQKMSRDFASMISVHYLYRFHNQPVRTAGISGVRYFIYNYDLCYYFYQ